MVVIIRSSPRSIMNSSDDRNESNHEYNFFLDKDIQTKLLNYDESSEEILNHFRINSGISRAPGKKESSKDGICGWAADTSFRQKKPEKAPKQPQNKDPPRWDVTRPAKEINYTFKHYRDIKDYMNQYRLQHTYNFGPLGKDGATVEIHTTRVTNNQLVQNAQHRHPPPRLKSNSDTQVRVATPNSHGPKGQNEPNILDLAHKYKFSPQIIRAAQSQMMDRVRGETDDPDAQSPTRSRVSSAASLNGRRIKSGKGSGSLQPNKVPAIPPSPTGIGQGKQSRKGSPSSTGAPFFQGKTMKHLPSNGYAIDSQTVNPAATNHKGQNNILSTATNSSVKTLDLLSHSMGSVDSKDPEGKTQLCVDSRTQNKSNDQEETNISVPKPSFPLDDTNYLAHRIPGNSGRTNVVVEIKVTPRPVDLKLFQTPVNPGTQMEVSLTNRTDTSNWSYSHVSVEPDTDALNTKPVEQFRPLQSQVHVKTIIPFTETGNDRMLMKNSDIESQILERCYTPAPPPVQERPLPEVEEEPAKEEDAEKITEIRVVKSTKAKEALEAKAASSCPSTSVMEESAASSTTSAKTQESILRPTDVHLKVSGSGLPPLSKSSSNAVFEQLASKGRNYVNSVRNSKTDSPVSSIKQSAEHKEVAALLAMATQKTDLLSNKDPATRLAKKQGVTVSRENPGEEEAYPPEWYYQQKIKKDKKSGRKESDPTSGLVEKDGPTIVDLSSGRLPTDTKNENSKFGYAKMWAPGSGLPQNNLLEDKAELMRRYLGDIAEFELERGERKASAADFRAGSAAIEHEKERKRMKASGLLKAAGLSFNPFSTSPQLNAVSGGSQREVTYIKKPQGSKRSKAIYGKKDLYHKTLKETLNDPTMLRAKAEFIPPSQAHAQEISSAFLLNDAHGDHIKTGFGGPEEIKKEANTPGVTEAQAEAQQLRAAFQALMGDLSWREKLEVLRHLPKPSRRDPKFRGARHSKSVEDIVNILKGQGVKNALRSGSKASITPSDAIRLQFLKRNEVSRSTSSCQMNVEGDLQSRTDHDRVVPECLDTFSDFFDPTVPADARFDKYLMEMERKQYSYKLTHKPLSRSEGTASVKGYDRHVSESYLEKRYKRGSKGGGWKVLPGIKQNTDSNFQDKVPVSSLPNDREDSLSDMSSSNNGTMFNHTTRW